MEGAAMKRSIFLVLAALTGLSGCVVGTRGSYYDPYYRDYHTWNDAEEAQFRIYLGERQQPYREYRRLDADQQRDYWQWRHAHPDNERH
jgi:hypothetical protein